LLYATAREDDALVGHVDEEVAVAHADAAIALYDNCVGVIEWRRRSDRVLEGAAVA
jgi:hypothetical protein